MYYGIQLIDPAWFLPVAFLVCAAISLSIGSSWTTAGTVGVGLMGLAHMIGVSQAMTAGVVIAGAYVGDKTSPLSETTVLAAQLNGVDLFRHIRYQAWTTVPAGLVALLVFVALGSSQRSGLPDATVSPSSRTSMRSSKSAPGTCCRSCCWWGCRSATCRRRWRSCARPCWRG